MASEQDRSSSALDELVSSLTATALSRRAAERDRLHHQDGLQAQQARRARLMQQRTDQVREQLIERARCLATGDTSPLLSSEALPASAAASIDATSARPTDQSSADGTLSRPQRSKPPKPALVRLYRDSLQKPEPWLGPPPNLTSEWFAVPVPAGQRCLVVAHGGRTTSWRPNGHPLHGRWHSELPDGGRCSQTPPHMQAPTSRAGSSGTLLDCVYVEAALSFFVLDVLCWRGYQLMDCPAEFRSFWLRSKLSEEVPSALSCCVTNHYPFVPLPIVAADLMALAASEALLPVPIHHFLMFWREGWYTAGRDPSPFVLRVSKPELAAARSSMDEEVHLTNKEKRRRRRQQRVRDGVALLPTVEPRDVAMTTTDTTQG